MDLYFSRRRRILHLARRYRLCSSSTRHSVMLESWSGLFKQHSFASLLFWLLFSSLQAVCSAIKLKIVVHFCIIFLRGHLDGTFSLNPCFSQHELGLKLLTLTRVLSKIIFLLNTVNWSYLIGKLSFIWHRVSLLHIIFDGITISGIERRHGQTIATTINYPMANVEK